MRMRWLIAEALLIFLLAGSLPRTLTAGPAAQKQKKRKDQTSEPKKSDAGAGTTVNLPDDRQIDNEISEMLGGWQLGDTTIMRKYYADDVTVVSGAWEPPVMGWENYLRAYQRQRERMPGARIDRSNTLIVVKGNIAWAIYQWDFAAMVDGQAMRAHGHTTLILEKRGERWLIVHDHTSIVPEVQPAAPAQQPTAPKPNPPGR